MNAKMYYHATVDTALGSMTELSNVKDVTLNLTAAEADVTSRANAGWRAIAAALRDASVDFGMVWKPADAGFTAIKDAFLTSAAIEIAILDQDRGTAGAQGLKGNFTITSFNREEPLEQAVMVSVTAKLVKFNAWTVV
jgi:TP901-1 family phage major tail protein